MKFIKFIKFGKKAVAIDKIVTVSYIEHGSGSSSENNELTITYLGGSMTHTYKQPIHAKKMVEDAVTSGEIIVDLTKKKNIIYLEDKPIKLPPVK